MESVKNLEHDRRDQLNSDAKEPWAFLASVSTIIESVVVNDFRGHCRDSDLDVDAEDLLLGRHIGFVSY